jgi:hypothetical protein
MDHHIDGLNTALRRVAQDWAASGLPVPDESTATALAYSLIKQHFGEASNEEVASYASEFRFLVTSLRIS